MSSSFSAKTTAQDVIDTLQIPLHDKNVIITGASSGIGAECARVFVKAGANVFLCGRDVVKTSGVADGIINELVTDAIGSGSINDIKPRVHVLELDLSSLSSVYQCIEQFKAFKLPLHILLNNAGCMALQTRTETTDGFEMQFGTNHLGHFVLTNGLIDSLMSGAPSRIVNVSSMAHRRGGVNFDDPQYKINYDPWQVYGSSKTANILHAIGLNRRFSDNGITAVSLHPGVIETELWRHAGLIFQMNKTIPEGAATSVFCCISPDVKGGCFYNDCQLSEAHNHATNPIYAEKLWELSLACINIK